MLDPNSGDSKNSPNECSIDHSLECIEEYLFSKLNFAKKFSIKILLFKRNIIIKNKKILRITINFFDLKLQMINIKKHSIKDIKADDEAIRIILKSKIDNIKIFFKFTFILFNKIPTE
jgi:hypothetical protein